MAVAERDRPAPQPGLEHLRAKLRLAQVEDLSPAQRPADLHVVAHARMLDRQGRRAGYLGACWVGVAVCWNVGRFWNGKGGTSIALATVKRFWS